MQVCESQVSSIQSLKVVEMVLISKAQAPMTSAWLFPINRPSALFLGSLLSKFKIILIVQISLKEALRQIEMVESHKLGKTQVSKETDQAQTRPNLRIFSKSKV